MIRGLRFPYWLWLLCLVGDWGRKALLLLLFQSLQTRCETFDTDLVSCFPCSRPMARRGCLCALMLAGRKILYNLLEFASFVVCWLPWGIGKSSLMDDGLFSFFSPQFCKLTECASKGPNSRYTLVWGSSRSYHFKVIWFSVRIAFSKLVLINLSGSFTETAMIEWKQVCCSELILSNAYISLLVESPFQDSLLSSTSSFLVILVSS